MSSTHRASRDRLARNAYMDVLGRTWSTEKLDSLLAMPAVQTAVDMAHRQGSAGQEGFRSGATYRWCLTRYRREAAGALLHLLVVRRHDLEARP